MPTGTCVWMAAGAICGVAGLTPSAARLETQELPDHETPRLVQNDGVDRPLPWTVRLERVIGTADSGAATFYRIYPWTVATDQEGNIYVLDVGDFHVIVFDSLGRPRRTLGSQGGGPGEFLRPVSLAISPSGDVAVVDEGKGALVWFAADGGVPDQRPYVGVGRLSAIAVLGRDTLGALGPPYGITGLVRIAGDSVRTIVSFHDEKTVSYPSCRVHLGGERPVFAPTVVWSAGGGVAVFNATPDYHINVHRGTSPFVVSRAIPPIEVDRAAAQAHQSVKNGKSITWAGGRCRVSPQDALDAVGFYSTLSPIQALAVGPAGLIWVLRRRPGGDDPVIDVLSHTGAYLGTLPEGTPFPVAFVSPRRFIRVARGEDEVPIVEVYRIER